MKDLQKMIEKKAELKLRKEVHEFISFIQKDKWEAIDLLVKAQSSLIDALLIMDNALEFNTVEYKEINERRMRDFIKKFEK